jgi:hypothetical protein
MICIQIGQRKSLSSSDMLVIGKVSPAAAAVVVVVVSVEWRLDGSGFTTAGTRGPSECSSIDEDDGDDEVLLRERERSEMVLMRVVVIDFGFSLCDEKKRV